MFLERFAIFTLRLVAKFRDLYNYFLREKDSQLGQIFFTCSVFFLTAILYYIWISTSPLWLQIGFTVIYLFSVLLCISALYFHIKGKRIRTTSSTMEVYNIQEEKKNFQHLNLKTIKLSEDSANAIFKTYSGKYFSGDYQNFQSLISLNPVAVRDRLIWIDFSPKRPKQVNRQTLLEFLSNLFIGFESLNNHQMVEFVEHYFILKNASYITQHISIKNVSDWRKNEAAYLTEISRNFKRNLIE